jgi:nicotinamidase-related amidase
MLKVLVVVDMQKDFTSGVLGNAECEAAVDKVAKVIRESDYDRVILTRDTHYDDYLDTREGRNLPVVHCKAGSDGWGIRKEIMDEVDIKYHDNYRTIDKPTFGSYVLSEVLQDYYEEDKDLIVDFCGVCTGICVISNVFLALAALPECKIRVIEDACACVTPKSHQTAIDAMKTVYVDII